MVWNFAPRMRRALICGAIALIAALVLSASGCGGVSQALHQAATGLMAGTPPWNMFGKNQLGQRQSEHKGPASSPRVLWKYETNVPFHGMEDMMTCSAVIGSDDTAYISTTYWNGSPVPPESMGLYAVSNVGQLLWFRQTTGCDCAPAVGPDGTIYVLGRLYDNTLPRGPGNYETLYAYQPDGTLQWKYSPGYSKGIILNCSPTVGSDGTVYIHTRTEGYPNAYPGVTAISPAGQQIWTYDIGVPDTDDPNPNPHTEGIAVASDGTVYFFKNQKLRALNSDGTLKWNFSVGSYFDAGGLPVIGGDGTLYLFANLGDASYGHPLSHVLAVSPAGSLKWNLALKDNGGHTMAMGPDGTLYHATSNNLYAINQNGTLKWTFTGGASGKNAGSTPTAAPAVDGNGTVYFSSGDGKVWAVNNRGQKIWNIVINQPPSSSLNKSLYTPPSIGNNGTVYVGSVEYSATDFNGGSLVAIGPGTP